MIELQPITQREAFAFIRAHHRHLKPPRGWLFGVAANDGEKVIGVAVVGRPESRMLQNGYTAEVTRLCTDGTPHVPSLLYGACWRAARALGYQRLITYTLKSESGNSVKATGWKDLGLTKKGGDWNRPSRPRVNTHPTEQKRLWEAQPGGPNEFVDGPPWRRAPLKTEEVQR